MRVCCLDLEGVLVPEVWICVARKTGIKALRLTTRDIRDYDQLMQYRLKILRQHGIRLRDIQKVIGEIKPLPGARRFLDRLKTECQVMILSDTFYEFVAPLMKQLGYPTLFCNFLRVNSRGFVTGYRLRQMNGKEKSVKALKKLNFKVTAVGDSYNDLTMLKAADRGILYRPPSAIRKEFSRFPAVYDYGKLLRLINR